MSERSRKKPVAGLRRPRLGQRHSIEEIAMRFDDWRQIGPNEFVALCPVHDDHNPSLAIGRGDTQPIVVVCRARRCPLDEVLAAVGLRPADLCGPPRDGLHAPQVEYDRRRLVYERSHSAHAFPASILPWLDHCHSALLGDSAVLQWLGDVRGLSADSVRATFMGWDASRQRLVLPIFEALSREEGMQQGTTRRIINLESYVIGGHNPKWTSSPGMYNGLYVPGYEDVPDGEVLITEGEFDAIKALQEGFVAATGTGGVGTWRQSWSHLFTDRDVTIAYDCDDPGRQGAAMVAAYLAPYARSIVDINLGLGHKEDITDYFHKYHRTADDLRQLRALAS